MAPLKLVETFEFDPTPEDEVWKELKEAYKLDTKFDESNVLYSMCNSPPEIARQAHLMFIEANLGDRQLYPGTDLLEKSVVNMMGELLHAPKKTASGYVLNGGSEANILALWIAREKYKSKKRNTKEPEVIAPISSHYSITVACHMLGLRLKLVPLDQDYRMNIKKTVEAINENTCAIVGIAGTTEVGVIDPVPELHQLCEDRDIHLHVDAAFGGFVFPFLSKLGYELPLFDFTLKNVRSITVDPHKMGRSTQPAGALIMRDKEDFNVIRFESYYLSSTFQHTMLGTRCSASVAATYAVMRRFGIKGYLEMVQGCMDNTRYVYKLLKERGFRLAIEEPYAPIAVIKLAEDKIDMLVRRLQETPRRWRVSRTRNPPGIRIVMMPHIKKEQLTSFVNDLYNLCKEMRII
jgi:tyrosine decarboxylase/aspartate 1-decarboxylase